MGTPQWQPLPWPDEESAMPRPGPIKPQPGGVPQFNPFGGLWQRLNAPPPNRPARSQDPTTAYKAKPSRPTGPNTGPAAAINRARSVRALPAAVAAATAMGTPTAGSPGGVAPTGPARPAPIPPQAPAPPQASPVPDFPPPPTAAPAPPPPTPVHPAQAFADRAVAEVAGANQARAPIESAFGEFDGTRRRDTPAAPVAPGGTPGALPSADNPQGVAAPGRSLQSPVAPAPESTIPGTGNPQRGSPSRLEQALSGVTAANSGGGLSERDAEVMQFYNRSGYAKDLRAAADDNLSKISNQAMRNAVTTGEAFTPVDISALNAPIVTGYTTQEADWDRAMTAHAGAGETMELAPGAAAYLQSGDAGNMLGGRRGDEIPGELASLGFRDPDSLPPLRPGAYTPAINLGLAYEPHTNETAFQPRVPWAQMRNWGMG